MRCGAATAGSCSVEEVFGPMGARRKVLVAILNLLAGGEPVPVPDVNAAVRALQVTNRSVFEAESYCAHLAKAGAVELVARDGTSYDQVAGEPAVDVVDGEEYARPAQKPPAYWRITQCGLEALAAQQPDARVEELLSSEPEYRHIYQVILEMCAREGGCFIADLEPLVDNDPATQHPRRLASRFTDRLEQFDAIEWAGTWRCTESGLRALEHLA